MTKAIFFDRDDTLIIDKKYMSDPAEITYFKYTMPLLKKLLDEGYLLFIVTNQSGIGRGYFTLDDMNRIHTKMSVDFLKENIKITDIAYCPHHPAQDCKCRKPQPKMIEDLCFKYDIDKSKSYMVGDKESDIEAGNNAGVSGIHINEFLEKFL